MNNSENSKLLRIKMREFFMSIEEYLYYLVAIGLILGFIIVMIDGLTILLAIFQKNYDITEGAIKFLDKILISLIFVEIFYTVLVAILEESAVKCVEPFILIAITALVRRLLILSFEISHSTHYPLEKLKFYLVEMGLVGALILMMIFSIILFRRSKKGGN